jgi:hypothetical protein
VQILRKTHSGNLDVNQEKIQGRDPEPILNQVQDKVRDDSNKSRLLFVTLNLFQGLITLKGRLLAAAIEIPDGN